MRAAPSPCSTSVSAGLPPRRFIAPRRCKPKWVGDAVSALEAALDLYRDDLLHPEDRYEEWTATARESWRSRQVEALTSLSHLEASRGNHRRASEIMYRVLALDPLREAAYRHLMRCALLQGDRDTALALYQRCAHILRRELGVQPEPATTRLFEEARSASQSGFHSA